MFIFIARPKYEHFDEWWGQLYETMGEVTYRDECIYIYIYTHIYIYIYIYIYI